MLGELINPCQTAFVKDRTHLDNFLSAHILTHHLHSSKRRAALLKIDFQRAFDQVNWDFLLDLLRTRGFSPTWIGWISTLLSSTSSAVFLNGVTSTFSSWARGLRQGDPLSPLLFNLCIDVIYRMLQQAASESQFLPVGVADVRFHSLQFADDLLLFLDGEVATATLFKGILDEFKSASGFKINFAKSAIIPVNLDSPTIQGLATIFGCPVTSFPFTYLGLPLSPLPLRKAEVLPLIEKIDKRLAGWKGSLLSRAGRLVLLNSVLSSIPTFFCSALRLPVWAVKAIDKIRCGFFWKGSRLVNGFHCLENWGRLCRPKASGGPRDQKSKSYELLSPYKDLLDFLSRSVETLGSDDSLTPL